MFEDAKHLSDTERAALAEIKTKVSALFDVRQYILFGSKARGDASADSDVDLLILTGRRLEHRERHMISDILTDVNLKYDTLFSFIAVDAASWHSRLYHHYPIHIHVSREGIPV